MQKSVSSSIIRTFFLDITHDKFWCNSKGIIRYTCVNAIGCVNESFIASTIEPLFKYTDLQNKWLRFILFFLKFCRKSSTNRLPVKVLINLFIWKRIIFFCRRILFAVKKIKMLAIQTNTGHVWYFIPIQLTIFSASSGSDKKKNGMELIPYL